MRVTSDEELEPIRIVGEKWREVLLPNAAAIWDEFCFELHDCTRAQLKNEQRRKVKEFI